MSFSAHKRDALDPSLPIHQRMSDLRSCAVLVAQKHSVPRSAIIERVRVLCGVDITGSTDEPGVQLAVEALVHLKESGQAL